MSIHFSFSMSEKVSEECYTLDGYEKYINSGFKVDNLKLKISPNAYSTLIHLVNELGQS